MTDPIREHITDIRQLAEEMALTAEGVPGMNLALSKARIASVCRAFLAATAPRPEETPTDGMLRAMLAAWFGRSYTHGIAEEVPEFVDRMKAVYAAALKVQAHSSPLAANFKETK